MIFFVATIVITLAAGYAGWRIARAKGRRTGLWAFCCAVLPPVVAVLAVLPDVTTRPPHRPARLGDRTPCDTGNEHDRQGPLSLSIPTS